MKVVFDGQIFSRQYYGGVSRYFVRLAEQLSALQVDVNILAPFHVNRYLNQLPGEYVKGWRLGRFPPKTLRFFIELNRKVSALWIQKLRPDLLHETYYSQKPVISNVKARILTVYDMIHEKFPNEFGLNDATSGHKRVAVNRADHIICISYSAKKDLCELFQVPAAKVSVVHLGFERFNGGSINKKAIKNNRPYLLYVGIRRGYKNFTSTLLAIAACPQIKKNFDLIAFGGGQLNREELLLLSRLGLTESTVKQMDGDDLLLGELYSNASAFIYPSLYEGFGLPLLEAMAYNCPVIASNTSSIPEVAGPAAQYFDPTDIQAQSEAIQAVVFNERRKAELILNGSKRLEMFSWERCAAETLDVYKQVLNARLSI
jgi:glycosyltransferase involved in cell wall biosynthesis